MKRREEEEARRIADEAEFVRLHQPAIQKEREERRAFDEEQKRQDKFRRMMEEKVEANRELEWKLICKRDRSLLSMMRQDYGDEVVHILRIWQVGFLHTNMVLNFSQFYHTLHVSFLQYANIMVVVSSIVMILFTPLLLSHAFGYKLFMLLTNFSLVYYTMIHITNWWKWVSRRKRTRRNNWEMRKRNNFVERQWRRYFLVLSFPISSSWMYVDHIKEISMRSYWSQGIYGCQ